MEILETFDLGPDRVILRRAEASDVPGIVGLLAADAISGSPELIGGQQAYDPGHIAGLGTPENDTIRTQVERVQELHQPSLPARRSGANPGSGNAGS